MAGQLRAEDLRVVSSEGSSDARGIVRRDPQSCATQLVINEAYVNSLKKGGKLTLTAKNRKNEDLTIVINLAGFTSVYDGEAALTFDEFSKNASGEAALEKILQDRAEAARQKLSGDGTAPAPTDPSAPATPQ